MYRLSRIVTAVGLLLAGSASAGPRGEFWGPPQDGYWGARYCLQGIDWAIRAFANSRLTSRARQPLRVPSPVVG